jgi:hypothetical protein
VVGQTSGAEPSSGNMSLPIIGSSTNSNAALVSSASE